MELMKKCLFCRVEFFSASPKRKFCSPTCRRKYHNLLYPVKRMMKDPTYKQKSLARLMAWKQRKKQEKMQQEAEKKGVKLIVADIDWI